MSQERLTAESTPRRRATSLALRGDLDSAARRRRWRPRTRRGRRAGAAAVVLDFATWTTSTRTGIALIVRLLAEARRDGREVMRATACPTTTGRSSRSPGCPTT